MAVAIPIGLGLGVAKAIMVLIVVGTSIIILTGLIIWMMERRVQQDKLLVGTVLIGMAKRWNLQVGKLRTRLAAQETGFLACRSDSGHCNYIFESRTVMLHGICCMSPRATATILLLSSTRAGSALRCSSCFVTTAGGCWVRCSTTPWSTTNRIMGRAETSFSRFIRTSRF